MPFAMGVLGAHWRGSHAPDEIIELVRDGNGDIFIKEKTSGETVMALRRTGANAYTLYNNTVAGGKILQDSSMKATASGLASLDANTILAVAQTPIKSGTYQGDATANKAIAHGLGRAPKLVIIHRVGTTRGLMTIVNGEALIRFVDNLSDSQLAVTAPDDTNFYVGNAGDYVSSANTNLANYEYFLAG